MTDKKLVTKRITWGDTELILETGKVAHRADSAVIARYGDTIVLATVCFGQPNRDISYFPLSVEFEERLYAGGRISTSRFIKREGRPRESAILSARLIDRSIRPLFPKDYAHEVQVIVTVLSVDQENKPDVLGAIAVSAALASSSIPWIGPVVLVRVGKTPAGFIANPKRSEQEQSDLDLMVSVVADGINMVEGRAKEVPESQVLEAIAFAQKEAQPILALVREFAKEVNVSKHTYTVEELAPKKEEAVRSVVQKELLVQLDKDPQRATDESWGPQAMQTLENTFLESVSPKHLARIFDDEFAQYVREKTLVQKIRVDGRAPKDIRPITVDVGLLPRTHGSALFRRGDTQALTVVTLGSPSLEQLIEGMTGEETKRYMHHYNFPPYSTGEVRRVGAPGRREIGHGALAERALVPVIPSEDTFPYTIRVVSEIMSSAGSTSMASVCGSTLALMDAGVPITAPVAGVAMGLITRGDQYVILSDIGYAEDANGDMDLKVAGTDKGITALQMDVKTAGVTHALLEEAIAQAGEGRLVILERMLAALPQSRQEVSQYAPKIATVKIDPAHIGDVIGSGGRTIREIQAATNASIDIEDDGTVTVTAQAHEQVERALKWIDGLTHKVQAGETYEGVVRRILPFGAFIEILPGREGMVHISQLAPYRVEKVEDIVSIGQVVRVRVAEIDQQGRVNLSMVFGTEARPAPRERFGRRFEKDRRPRFRR